VWRRAATQQTVLNALAKRYTETQAQPALLILENFAPYRRSLNFQNEKR
jgi:hypothetical protein